MPVNTLKSDRDSIKLEDLGSTEINPATEEKQDLIISEQQQLEIIQNSIQELVSRLDFLPSVRGIAADLRVTLLSGVVTSVTTLSNQTSIGGYLASSMVQNSQNNLATIANINNIAIV